MLARVSAGYRGLSESLQGLGLPMCTAVDLKREPGAEFKMMPRVEAGWLKERWC